MLKRPWNCDLMQLLCRNEGCLCLMPLSTNMCVGTLWEETGSLCLPTGWRDHGLVRWSTFLPILLLRPKKDFKNIYTLELSPGGKGDRRGETGVWPNEPSLPRCHSSKWRDKPKVNSCAAFHFLMLMFTNINWKDCLGMSQHLFSTMTSPHCLRMFLSQKILAILSSSMLYLSPFCTTLLSIRNHT